MALMTLGAYPVKAAADTTGLNPNNYTAAFSPSVIPTQVPVFELYHLYVTAPTLVGVSTTATVMLNTNYWDVTLIGQANSWDPSQPMLMRPGDTLYVLFNVPTSNTTVPTVTAWFRYENL